MYKGLAWCQCQFQDIAFNNIFFQTAFICHIWYSEVHVSCKVILMWYSRYSVLAMVMCAMIAHLKVFVAWHLANAGLLSIRHLKTNFNEILTEIQTFWLPKMHLKVLSAQGKPFCLGRNVLAAVCMSLNIPDNKVHGANMGSSGSCRPRLPPLRPYEPCYQGCCAQEAVRQHDLFRATQGTFSK